jgi:16S rRNA (guanine966-N2)-methyltransferase
VLRIIGGRWRGRKWRFPAAAAIRPTPDRVRETLFNWLGARTQGAHALDLFAGSGALGLEALSRGAAHVTFIEKDAEAARELRARLTEWQAENAQVLRADALDYLARAGAAGAGAAGTGTAGARMAGASRGFDLVFLDPPFASTFLSEAAALLEERHWLAESAVIYVECAAREPLPSLPAAWRVLKAKRAGEVGYHLLTRTAP